MVACLEKTARNSEFHEIVDFLTSSLIHHAVIVSPTIYISYIEQFWNTASSQTVNDEKQIHATVDSKAVVVTEASIRSSLLLNDVDGTAFLTNEAIFQNLELMSMSRKGLKFSGRITPLFSNMLASAEVEEGDSSEQPTEPQPTPSPTQPSVGDQPHATDLSSGPDNTHSPSINLEGGNTSERAKGGLNLEELLSLCTNLSNRVLALETAKDAQAAKILKLKTRIKKLEKKCKPSISHHKSWLKSVKRLSMKNKLGKKEPVSKQGRKSAKPGPTLDAFDDLDADLAHGIDYMDTEEAMTEGRQSKETKELNVTHDTEVLEKGGSNEEPVNVAGNIRVSTAFNISTSSRPEGKLKGVEIKEKKDAKRHAISVLTLKPLPIIDPKDKCKGVLEEEPEPVKVKSKDQGEAQIERDAEIALKVQAELDEKARLERQRQEQESLNYIANLYTVDERAKLLAEYFENRKK
ncbi:hypothetical protein Tco_1399218 [Tanacetum coccineum]